MSNQLQECCSASFFSFCFSFVRCPLFARKGTIRTTQNFSTPVQNMRRLPARSCHHRADNSSRPSFPGHKDCTGCHLTQFTTPNIPMCSICHQIGERRRSAAKAFSGQVQRELQCEVRSRTAHDRRAPDPRADARHVTVLLCDAAWRCRSLRAWGHTMAATLVILRTRRRMVATWRHAECVTRKHLMRARQLIRRRIVSLSVMRNTPRASDSVVPTVITTRRVGAAAAGEFTPRARTLPEREQHLRDLP